MGQSNQVDQLKLLQKVTLMKNCDFFEDLSKPKNANRLLLIIYIFLTLEKDGRDIKISTRMKKFHF